MKEPRDKTYLFEEMPVRQAVLRQIAPSIASQMVILLYNLADTYFVGKLNDPAQTAAVTVAYTVTVLMTAIANLFAVGGASCVAQALGRRSSENAKEISAISFWCCLGSAVVFSALFACLARPVLTFCGATEETYHLAVRYAKWVVVVGGPATILNVLLANLVRAEGSAFAASLGISLGGVVNIFLDPFFVLPGFLGLGAEGAGIATAISNGVSTLVLLGYLLSRRENSVLRLHPRYLRYTARHIRRIVSIGIPSAVQYLLTMVAVGALNNFVAGYETAAVAALGIVKKCDMLPLYFSIGAANGILPLLAYNFSAGNHQRRHKVFLCGCTISVGFSLFCVVCYELFAPALIALFMDDPATIAYGTKFLRIMVLAMPLMSVCYPMITQFQAMGRAKESLVCSVLRKGVLDIPLLFVMDKLIPLYGCTMVQPMVDSISMVVAIYFYRKIIREEQGRHPDR